MKTPRLAAVLLLASACFVLVAGCAKKPEPAAASTPARHEHKSPHGGTAVVLGDEAYHVEFVRDAASGTLQAFILDGELENFIRAAASSFKVVATVDGAPRTLVFKPVANSATGETVGDTSLFEAQADWLESKGEFAAVLESITIRGSTFRDVKFNFPGGNDKD